MMRILSALALSLVIAMAAAPALAQATAPGASRLAELQYRRDLIREELSGHDTLFVRIPGLISPDGAVRIRREVLERELLRLTVIMPGYDAAAAMRNILEFDRQFRTHLQALLADVERQIAQAQRLPQPGGSLFGSGSPMPPGFDEYIAETQRRDTQPLPPPAQHGPSGPLTVAMVEYTCKGPHGTMSGGRVVQNYRCEIMLEITNTGASEFTWQKRYVDATDVDGNVRTEELSYWPPTVGAGQTTRVNAYCIAPEPSWSGIWKAYGSAVDGNGKVERWEISGTCP